MKEKHSTLASVVFKPLFNFLCKKILKENAVNNYVLVEKEEGKLKNSTDIDIQEYIKDCPEVVAKYKEGGYGVTPTRLLQ